MSFRDTRIIHPCSPSLCPPSLPPSFPPCSRRACAEGVLFCTPVGRLGGRKEDVALLSESTGQVGKEGGMEGEREGFVLEGESINQSLTKISVAHQDITHIRTHIHTQQGGVPLILFPPPSPPPPPPPPQSTSQQAREEKREGGREGGREAPVVIISPMDNFMAVNVFFENRSQVLQYGVQGKVGRGGGREGGGITYPSASHLRPSLPPSLPPPFLSPSLLRWILFPLVSAAPLSSLCTSIRAPPKP